jgi:hypothetical protein
MEKPTIECYFNDCVYALYKDGEPYLLYHTDFMNFLNGLSEDFPEGFNFVSKGEIDDETLELDFY